MRNPVLAALLFALVSCKEPAPRPSAAVVPSSPQPEPTAWSGLTPSGRLPTLEELTVLRRSQGKPDPLTVEVMPNSGLIVEFPEQPRIHVRLINTDVERASFEFKFGGDYRSGRLARWRIDTNPPNPRTTPWPGAWVGGGMYSLGPLEPGAAYAVTLPLMDYTAPLDLGGGTLEVIYSESVCIADEFAIDGLIVFRSEPCRFEIRPRRVVLTDAVRSSTRAAVAALDCEHRVLLTTPPCASVARWDEPPATQAESVLHGGWPAFAALVEFVDDPALSVYQRAWVLALLYDLSGLLDPASPGLVESATRQVGAWATGQGSALVLGGTGSVEFGTAPNESAQARYVDAWKALRHCVVIE